MVQYRGYAPGYTPASKSELHKGIYSYYGKGLQVKITRHNYIHYAGTFHRETQATEALKQLKMELGIIPKVKSKVWKLRVSRKKGRTIHYDFTKVA